MAFFTDKTKKKSIAKGFLKPAPKNLTLGEQVVQKKNTPVVGKEVISNVKSLLTGNKAGANNVTTTFKGATQNFKITDPNTGQIVNVEAGSEQEAKDFLSKTNTHAADAAAADAAKKQAELDAAAAQEQEAEDLFGFNEFTSNQAVADKYGIDSKSGGNLFSSTLEEEISKQKDKQAADAAFLKQQQDFQKKQELQQFHDLKRSGASQASGVEASLMPGREGFIGGTAQQGIQQFKQLIAEKIDIAAGKLQQAENSRNQQLQQLKDAQDSGNKQLVKSIKQGIAGAEQTIRQEKENLINAQIQANDQTLKINADTRANISAFQTVVESGVELNTNQLLSFANSLGLPADQVNGIYQGLQAIRDDKTLTIEQKQIQTDSMMETLQDQIRGVETEKAKNIDLYTNLVRTGYFASDDERYTFARALGIEEFDDPFVQLDFQIKALQAERDAANDPLDIQIKNLQIKKLQQEYDEAAGIVPGSNGIEVGDFGNTADLPNENVKTTSAFGEGQVTGYGSSKWGKGLDYQLSDKMDAPVAPSFGYEVIKVSGESCGPRSTDCNGGWGKQVKIKNLSDDKELWISHLNSIDVEQGETYSSGTSVGGQGNSGTVMGDTGIHLDLTMPNPDGGYYTAKEVASYLGVGQTPAPSDKQYSLDQLKTLRNLYGSTIGANKSVTKTTLESLKTAGLNSFDLTSFDPDKAPLPDAEVKQMLTQISTLQDLLTHDGFEGAVGFSVTKVPFFGVGITPGDTNNWLLKFSNFKSKQILPLLSTLKGAMSDKDLAFLESAATELFHSQTEEGFIETANKLETELIRILQDKGQYDTVSVSNSSILDEADTYSAEDILSEF